MDVVVRMDAMEASLEGQCSDLGGRMGQVEHRLEDMGKMERRMQAMEQHVEVLQAHVDVLQSQVQKEVSRSAELASALKQSNADLRATQLTSAELMQAVLQLVSPSRAFEAPPLLQDAGGADPAARLRGKLAALAGDIVQELSSNCSTMSPRSSQGGHVRQRASAPSSARSSAPTLLGRVASVPSLEASKPFAAATPERPAPPPAEDRAVGLGRGSPAQGMPRSRVLGGGYAPPRAVGGSGSFCAAPPPRTRASPRPDVLLDAPPQRQRQRSVGAGEQVLSELQELREINMALREENLEMRDRMLREQEGQKQEAQRSARLAPPQTTTPSMPGPPSILIHPAPMQRMSSMPGTPQGRAMVPGTVRLVASRPRPFVHG